jgi:hypothetical protein
MSARDGGKLSKATDPRQMMVEAGRAKRRHQRTRDLILGPLMLACGITLAVMTVAAVAMVRVKGGFIVVYYGAILGLIIGGVKKLIRGIAACFRERVPVIEIRPISVDGDVYRRAEGPPFGRPPIRRVEPRPLAEVVAALAALTPVVRRKSLLVGGLWVGIRTPHAVEPSTMTIEGNDFRDVVELAHALVPLFGAIAIDCLHLRWIVVDGTRSVAELCAELAERQRQHEAMFAE